MQTVNQNQDAYLLYGKNAYAKQEIVVWRFQKTNPIAKKAIDFCPDLAFFY